MQSYVQRSLFRSEKSELSERCRRIRGNASIFKYFARVAAADQRLELFKSGDLRYPVLVVHGQPMGGKTEWATSLLRSPLGLNIGTFDHLPDAMRQFGCRLHHGLILNDIRDLSSTVRHQEKLQGKHNRLVESASTPGGQCAYSKDLHHPNRRYDQ